eukprot:ctg_6276.g662
MARNSPRGNLRWSVGAVAPRSSVCFKDEALFSRDHATATFLRYATDAVRHTRAGPPDHTDCRGHSAV